MYDGAHSEKCRWVTQKQTYAYARTHTHTPKRRCMNKISRKKYWEKIYNQIDERNDALQFCVLKGAVRGALLMSITNAYLLQAIIYWLWIRIVETRYWIICCAIHRQFLLITQSQGKQNVANGKRANNIFVLKEDKSNDGT